MRILLVEDEPEIAKFIENGLERERFVVDTVEDGRNGLYQAAVHRYDLILCDFMLPHRNGIDLTRELRDRAIATPLLMLTVVDDLGTRVQALNAGADDFMCKPFSFEELLARMRALLRREISVRKECLRVGDLEMDVSAHEVRRNGHVIALTRKQFVLLEYLMRNPDRVLSRGQILEHVWGSGTDPVTNSIEVHVRHLRQKIDAPFSAYSHLLHTVHGVGYKLSTQAPPKVIR
jgi:two-component system copper resistance phosphate regulon response regulator CusR